MLSNIHENGSSLGHVKNISSHHKDKFIDTTNGSKNVKNNGL